MIRVCRHAAWASVDADRRARYNATECVIGPVTANATDVDNGRDAQPLVVQGQTVTQHAFRSNAEGQYSLLEPRDDVIVRVLRIAVTK